MLYTQNDLGKVTRFNYGIFMISMSIFKGFLAVSLRRKGFCVWEDAYRNFHAGVPLFEHLFWIALPERKGSFRVYQFENRFFVENHVLPGSSAAIFRGKKNFQIGFRECISLVYSPPQRVVLLSRCFYVHDSTFQLNIDCHGARGHLDCVRFRSFGPPFRPAKRFVLTPVGWWLCVISWYFDVRLCLHWRSIKQRLVARVGRFAIFVQLHEKGWALGDMPCLKIVNH